MSNLHRESSIDASYQVLVHLAKRFQRRFKCEHLTEGEHNVMSKVHLAFWTGELNKKSAYSLQRTIFVYTILYLEMSMHLIKLLLKKYVFTINIFKFQDYRRNLFIFTVLDFINTNEINLHAHLH
jgi:hypothetical protein